MNDTDALKSLSDEELQQELARRAIIAKYKAKPRPVDSPDWSDLRRLCIEYIDQIDEEGTEMKDFEHWVEEAALHALFGPDIYNWINKQIE